MERVSNSRCPVIASPLGAAKGMQRFEHDLSLRNSPAAIVSSLQREIEIDRTISALLVVAQLTLFGLAAASMAFWLRGNPAQQIVAAGITGVGLILTMVALRRYSVEKSAREFLLRELLADRQRPASEEESMLDSRRLTIEGH